MQKKEKIIGIHMALTIFMKDGECQVTVKFEYENGNCEIWDVKSYLLSELHLLHLWNATIESMATAFEVQVKQSYRFVPE